MAWAGAGRRHDDDVTAPGQCAEEWPLGVGSAAERSNDDDDDGDYQYQRASAGASGSASYQLEMRLCERVSEFLLLSVALCVPPCFIVVYKPWAGQGSKNPVFFKSPTHWVLLGFGVLLSFIRFFGQAGKNR